MSVKLKRNYLYYYLHYSNIITMIGAATIMTTLAIVVVVVVVVVVVTVAVAVAMLITTHIHAPHALLHLQLYWGMDHLG
jgi:hypothetical protein